MDKDARYDNICHHVRNGLLVIRGLIRQGEVGNLTTEEVYKKIWERALSLERELLKK